MKAGLTKKALLVSLVAALLVLTVAGCGAKKSAGYQAVMSSGKLIVGTEATYPPYEYVDEQNQIVGFDMDLAAEVAKDLGVQMEISEMQFTSLIPALQTGKISMIAAAMDITPERAKTIDFSDPYFSGGQTIVVNTSDTSITQNADLAGKRIGVQTGTTGDEAATNGYPTAKITRYDTFTAAFLDLQNGKLDAIVLGEPVADAYIAVSNGKFKKVGDPLTSEQPGFGFAKGDKDLVAAANKTLARLKQDGTYQQLVDKWFK